LEQFVATGVGSSGITTITFATQAAALYSDNSDGEHVGNFWSIHEFNVFRNFSIYATGLVAGASGNQINLAWNAGAGALGYNVKRAVTSGGTTRR